MRQKFLLGQFVLPPLWENISHSPTTGISPGLLLQYSFRSNADHVVHALDEVDTIVTLYTWMHRAALGLSGPVVHEKTHLHRSRSFQMPLECVDSARTNCLLR